MSTIRPNDADRGFAEFLEGLFLEGRVTFPGKPEAIAPMGPESSAVLSKAFASVRLDVAGPAIALDEGVARQAARVLRQSCWALVCRDDRVDDLRGRLAMERAPKTPAEHLSADLLLRYLPGVHRRARAVDPVDPLLGLIGDVLRQWPLSGVLARLDEPPTTALEFGGHPGLALLYAERLSPHAEEGWRPVGPAREYVELVRSGA